MNTRPVRATGVSSDDVPGAVRGPSCAQQPRGTCWREGKGGGARVWGRGMGGGFSVLGRNGGGEESLEEGQGGRWSLEPP